MTKEERTALKEQRAMELREKFEQNHIFFDYEGERVVISSMEIVESAEHGNLILVKGTDMNAIYVIKPAEDGKSVAIKSTTKKKDNKFNRALVKNNQKLLMVVLTNAVRGLTYPEFEKLVRGVKILSKGTPKFKVKNIEELKKGDDNNNRTAVKLEKYFDC